MKTPFLSSVAFIALLTPASAQNCGALCDPATYLDRNTDAVQLAIDAGESLTPTDGAPLATAIGIGTLAQVQALLEAGADINSVDARGTPMLIVAANYEPRIPGALQLLLREGAAVDARDAHGRTALHYVVTGSGAPHVIFALTAEGADVNARSNDGNTPLHEITRMAEIFAGEMWWGVYTAILVQAGADINAQNNAGQTPLHIAAGTKDAKLVAQLLDAGADGSVLDSEGRTPFAIAATYFHFSKHPVVWAQLEAAQ